MFFTQQSYGTLHDLLGVDLLKMSRSTLLLAKVALVVKGVELINHGILEMPGGDTLLEEDIELSISPALGFRKAEEGPEEAAEASSGVEEASFGTPVPCSRVQHARSENVSDDRGKIVGVAGNNHGLLAETSRWDLCDDGVADGANGAVVCCGEE